MNVPNIHEGTLYPNLFIYYSNVGTNESSFAAHAGVTTELFMAVLKEREELSFREFCGIRGLTGIPVKILMLPQIIRMERDHYKHRKMIDDLYSFKDEIIEGAKAGESWCKRFAENNNIGSDMSDLERLRSDFYAGSHVSYTRYLAVKHEVDNCVYFCRAEQEKPRGLPEEKKKPKKKFIHPTCVVISHMLMKHEQDAEKVKQFMIDNGLWHKEDDINREGEL